MAKRKTAKRASRVTSRRHSTVHGLEHDFVLIAGGGFVLLVLIMVFLLG